MSLSHRTKICLNGWITIKLYFFQKICRAKIDTKKAKLNHEKNTKETTYFSIV